MKIKRRKFLAGAGAAAAAAVVGGYVATRPGHQPDLKLPPAMGTRPRNILLITSDQEQAWARLPQGFIERHCPGRAQIARDAVSFLRAHTPTPVCSTARGCLYTGVHSQNNGVWDNIPLPYAPTLKRDVPTLGTLMKGAGFHTAYFGKWHLTRLYSGKHEPFTVEQVRQEIGSFGFDEVGTDQEHDGPLGGFEDDYKTADTASAFLKRQANADTPWFAAVNIVNPHDIMYYTAGPEMTASRKITYPDQLKRPPQTALYNEDLGYRLPDNFGPATAGGRVPAVVEYSLCDDIALGRFPYEDPAACRDFANYYYNCIRDSDRYIEQVMEALVESGQLENTIVIFTADHGEMLGVHGLRGKGVVPYREATNVPLMVRHPDHLGFRTSEALTSHVDLAPTLLALAGVPRDTVQRGAPELIGRDFSEVITRNAQSGPRDKGDGLLMHWTSLIYQDHISALSFDEERKKSGATNLLVVLKPQFRGTIQKRGQMRCVFDGRYKFARYFSPCEHQTPQTWEALLAFNDIELYDLLADPGENHNLAADPASARSLILSLNDKLNRLLRQEVGQDDGHHLPGPTFFWKA